METMKELRKRCNLRDGVEQDTKKRNGIDEGGRPRHQVLDRFLAMPSLMLTSLDLSGSPSGVLEKCR
eukprot:394274-Amphidinium_carterae.1